VIQQHVLYQLEAMCVMEVPVHATTVCLYWYSTRVRKEGDENTESKSCNAIEYCYKFHHSFSDTSCASSHMPQLLNTAITRAREWLIVVGEPITLCTVGSNRLCWLEFIWKCHQYHTFEYINADHFGTFLETKLIARFALWYCVCVSVIGDYIGRAQRYWLSLYRQILEKTHENFFRKMESVSHNISVLCVLFLDWYPY